MYEEEIGGRAGRVMNRLAGEKSPYLLQHAAYAATAPDQDLLSEPLRIDGPLEGYAACAMTGSNSPVFPDVHGRWTPILNCYDSLGRLRGAAATVRAGFSDAGLPVGLQIVGPRHRDDLVLQAAPGEVTE